MKPFNELSTPGKIRRLRSLALKALDSYDLDVRNVRFLASETNCSFRVDTEARDRFVLRVCDPNWRIEGDLCAELHWLMTLNNTTTIRAPHPIPTMKGEYWTTVDIEGVPESRDCVLFNLLPGRELGDDVTAESVFKLGELTALMHRFASSFEPPGRFAIRSLSQMYPFGEPEVLFNDEFQHLYPTDAFDVTRRVVDVIKTAIERLYTGHTRPIVVHGDIHQWNVLIHHGQLSIIDHEDIMWGFPAQDIGVTFHYLQRKPNYVELRSEYRTGYETVAFWPQTYPGEIDIYVAHRGVHLMNYVLYEMSKDLELVNHFMEYPLAYWKTILDG